MFHGSRCGWLAQYVSLIQAVLGIVEETGAGIAPLKGQLRVILAPAEIRERLKWSSNHKHNLGFISFGTLVMTIGSFMREWRAYFRFRRLPPNEKTIVFYAENAGSWRLLEPHRRPLDVHPW